MRQKVLAFDYDGTLAENGQVPATLCHVLEQLKLAGCVLFLVTGRRYGSMDLGSLAELFTGIAWENGAVLEHMASQELYLPFGYVNARLIQALEKTNMPLERGVAIASTWTDHEAMVWQLLAETGNDVVIVHNKGALMILPPGTSKGTGLVRLLELCGFSPRNVACFGDGENDLALFQVCEVGIAVADAVPSLLSVADFVAAKPGPAGVQHTLETYWQNDAPLTIPTRPDRSILLGTDENGKSVLLSATMLTNSNIGVFGDSHSGKSWVTGLLAEGMHVAGYQVLLLDPEGDFRGLGSLPGIIALSGDETTLPSPATVVLLLAEASNSVVLDLCQYPHEQRGTYLVELFHALQPLKKHKFRPQWIVLEEAQYFLPPSGNDVFDVLLPMLADGGWAFVSYRPDRLEEQVLDALTCCLVSRLTDEEALAAISSITQLPDATALAQTPNSHIWLCGQQQVRLRPSARRIPHIRHLYKYLDMPLPKHKRFYFRTDKTYLGVEAASLFEFKELLLQLPLACIEYHHQRDDFANWVRSALDDDILARHLETLTHRQDLVGEALRQALWQCAMARYVELSTLR